MDLVRDDVRPSSIRHPRRRSRTRSPSVAATGGSTNGVLHLLAIAHEFGIPLDIDEFGAIADRTPIVADLQPGGRYTATDLYDAGGVALVMRELLEARPAPRRRRRTSTAGRSPRSRPRPPRPPGQEVVVPIERPLKPTGGLAILRGSLAPDGCVVKLAGHERRLPPRPGPRLRLRDAPATRRSATGGSSPATSSSSATRARSADPGCRRC